MISKIKNSITYKILLSFVLLSAFLTVITTVITMRVEYRDEIKKIQKELGNIERSFLPVIRESLWEMDKDNIGIALNGLLYLPNIEYIEIKQKDRIIASVGSRQSKDTVDREFPLYRDFAGKKIHVGTVYITLGMKNIYAGLYRRALINLVSHGLETFALSLCLFLIVNFFVIRHLRAITDYFKQTELDGLSKNLILKAQPMSGGNVDEVSQIVNAVNAMTARIKKSIDDFKKLEAQLRQSQKMEAVGTLAGGVAHDFNNILTAIIGYGNILKMKLEKDSPLMGYTDQILASAERAAGLTQRLLAFSRKQVINPQPVNLNEVVAGIEKLLLRIIGEDIELKTILSGKVSDLKIMADAGQLEQVLINLAANARDAMPKGGTLTIETGVSELGADFIDIHEYGKSGMYAQITVTDTGYGMDEDTRQRVFEPFFTTKEIGKGTGLGMSMVYGIIKQHNGYINCYSELGRGTTFKIYLPLTGVEVAEIKPPKPSVPLKGTETILLAEDEETVRELAKTVLKESGYKVIEAVDGEDAVAKFMENKDGIDLFFADVVMPRMSGKEAYERIKEIKPDIKLLMASGYPEDFISNKGIIEQGLNYIAKPMSPINLLKKIREALDK